MSILARLESRRAFPVDAWKPGLDAEIIIFSPAFALPTTPPPPHQIFLSASTFKKTWLHAGRAVLYSACQSCATVQLPPSYFSLRTERGCPGTHLILYGHHQDASDLQQHLHVILMVLLHSGAAVNAVVLVAVRGDLQAVPHLEDGFTELKPADKRRGGGVADVRPSRRPRAAEDTRSSRGRTYRSCRCT